MRISDLHMAGTSHINLFEAIGPMRVCVFAGRFQPMHPGHAAVFRKLQEQFDRVVLATSDKVEEGKSPFNFGEKVMIATHMFGIQRQDMVCSNRPYNADPVLEQLGLKPENAVITFAVGSKDNDRFAFKEGETAVKKDGSPSYLQAHGHSLETADKHGYVIHVPDVSDGENVYHASDLREALRGDEETARRAFESFYNRSNDQVFQFMRSKIA